MFNTSEEKLDDNLLSYLSLLISEGSIIPLRFFTLFELSRIETEGSKIIKINEKQQKMIICFYIFIKILLNSTLLPKMVELTSKKKQENVIK